MGRLKVFLAIALGAFLGGITALWLDGSFWWAGVLVGGVIGFVVYDIEQIIQATQSCYREMTSHDARYNMGLVRYMAYSLGGRSSRYILVGTVFFTLVSPSLIKPAVVNTHPFLILGSIAALSFLISMAFTLKVALDEYSSNYKLFGGGDVELLVNKAKKDFLTENLFSYALRKCKQLKVNLKKFVIGLCKLTRFLAVLSWRVFRAVSTEIRLLCGAYAALGATAVYFTHAPFRCAAFAAVIGLLHYEILYKRVFRPTSQSATT